MAEQCSICFNSLEKSVSLECNHDFHKKCIFKWKKIKNSCPICRSQIQFKGSCKGIYKSGDKKGEHCCSPAAPGELYCKRHSLELNIKIRFDIKENVKLVEELTELSKRKWLCVCDMSKFIDMSLLSSPAVIEINLRELYDRCHEI